MEAVARITPEQLDVVMRADVGPGAKYRARSAVFREMALFEVKLFEARTYVERASVRGAAYGFGASNSGFGKWQVWRVDPGTVAVKRVR